MKQKRVTIFGGSGFLGRYVVELLADQGAIITVAVRDVEKAKFLKPLGQVGQITPIKTNARNKADLAKAVENADIVINLIGILYKQGQQTFEKMHINIPQILSRLSTEAGVDSLLQVSAIGANQSAVSEYLRTKGEGEKAIYKNFPGAIILRPSVIFGPEDKFFNLFGSLSRISPILPLYGNGKTFFQPIYVRDVASAIVGALSTSSSKGKTYEIGGPHVYSYTELMKIVLHNTRRRCLLLPVPFLIGEIQGRIMDLMPKPLLTYDQMLSLKADNIVSENAFNLSDLGIQPTAVETIIPTYLSRYRKGGRLGRASMV
jgi:uncharacterized protein YbjT (DUF2867 family)